MKNGKWTTRWILCGILLLGFITNQSAFGQPDPEGTNSDGGSYTNSFLPTRTPSVFSYPTNATLKWYLTMNNSPFYGNLSLSPNGTLYIPIGSTGAGTVDAIWSVNTSSVNTNDPNYPSPIDFTNWVANYNSGGEQMTPLIGADGTIYGSISSSIFSAFNPTNGATLWDFLQGGGQSAIANDGTVYTSNGNQVFALTNAFGFTNSYVLTNWPCLGSVDYCGAHKWPCLGSVDYQSVSV